MLFPDWKLTKVQYLQQWKRGMQEAYQIVKEQSSTVIEPDSTRRSRKMNTTLTNSTLYKLHPLILSFSSSTLMSVHIIYFTLGLPLNICVIIHLIRAGGLDGFVIFSLSHAVSEILFALPAPLLILCHVNVTNLCFVKPIVFFTAVCMCTRFFFQCCVCFERYLAVVHPVLFLKNKSVKHRLLGSAFIWMYSLTCGTISTNDFLNLPYPSFGILYAILLSVHLYFCLSILRVLRRPGPSERERTDGGVNVIKKKAFELVICSLLAFLIQTIPIAAAFSINNVLSSDTFSLAVRFSMIINIGAGIVQPVLLLHQMGKLPFEGCV
ncbi:hypothetical protein MHYP_G00243870 [Metynnis hypsauchen]